MKMLKEKLEHLEEEIEGAREYAEKFIKCKSGGNMARANRFKEMAQDELKHATYLRDMDLVDVADLKKVYNMTEEEESMWEHGQKHLTDQIAMVMHILSM